MAALRAHSAGRPDKTHSHSEKEFWLCLSGGNALGAYHAGAYEALEQVGLIPSRIAGASIGAVMGALIAGNRPEDRLPRLRQFWQKAEQHGHFLPASPFVPTDLEQWLSLSQTLAHGRPGLFHPAPGALGSLSPLLPSPSHIFDTSPLRATLEKLIDFGRLKDGPMRLLVTAVDAETGEDVVFDSHAGGVEVDHLMASTAFPIAFPPVHLGGKVYVDPGVSANLPIMPLFNAGKPQDVFCLALDLVSTVGKVPGSLSDAVGRAHDLVFGSQSRHALRQVRLAQQESPGGATVVHLAYCGREQEIGGKSLDFSRRSIQQRWAAGSEDTAHILSNRDRFDEGRGCRIYRAIDGEFVPLEA